jgi:hypothetical protein
MEAAGSSEVSVPTYQTTRPYVPEDHDHNSVISFSKTDILSPVIQYFLKYLHERKFLKVFY